jgi:Type III restriction enzyme, res subunit
MPAPTSLPETPPLLIRDHRIIELTQKDPDLWLRLKNVSFTRRGFLIDRTDDNDHIIDIIADHLTYHYPEPKKSQHWNQTVPLPLTCFRRTLLHLLVPKQWALYAFANTGVLARAKNQMFPGIPISLSFHSQRRLIESDRCPQQTVVEFMHRSLQNTGGVVVISPVGTGKTVMACNLISRVRLKTLVVVGNDGLLDQWEERIREYLPGCQIGKIQGPVCQVDGNDIVLGMVQSLYNHNYPDSAMSQIGLVIFDEAHHASAPSFINSLWQISCPYMVALTQDPTRKDGMTTVLYNFFSFNVKIVAPRLPDGIELWVERLKLSRHSNICEEELAHSGSKRKGSDHLVFPILFLPRGLFRYAMRSPSSRVVMQSVSRV